MAIFASRNAVAARDRNGLRRAVRLAVVRHRFLIDGEYFLNGLLSGMVALFIGLS